MKETVFSTTHPTEAERRWPWTYAARSGVTVEWLHRHGRYGERCRCSDLLCLGWAMGHQHEDALSESVQRDLDSITTE